MKDLDSGIGPILGGLGRQVNEQTSVWQHRLNPSYATFIKLLPVYQDWLQGNVQHAHDELVRLDQTSPSLDPVFVGSFYGMFGCLKEEAEHYRTSRYQKLAYDALVLIEFQRGNWSEVNLRRNAFGLAKLKSDVRSPVTARRHGDIFRANTPKRFSMN